MGQLREGQGNECREKCRRPIRIFRRLWNGAERPDVDCQLSFTGQFLKQVISVKNESPNTIRVKLECGFFHEHQLIAADMGYALGSSGFTEILTQSNVSADRTQCRIVEAQ
jgi:hypothetical protein